MFYTPLIQKAVNFAISIHETDRKQKRKGKDIPYIIHPLTVGLILSRVTDDENLIAAGILHDTIEDCSQAHPVTKEVLTEIFNEDVAELVWSVTEKDSSLPWKERKQQALEEIAHMTRNQQLLKSADILSNITELNDDIKKDGRQVFERFSADQVQTTGRYNNLNLTLRKSWPENPLLPEIDKAVRWLTGKIVLKGE